MIRNNRVNDLVNVFLYEFLSYCKNKLSGSNSVVECQLPKLDVAGSNPVSRSEIISL